MRRRWIILVIVLFGMPAVGHAESMERTYNASDTKRLAFGLVDDAAEDQKECLQRTITPGTTYTPVDIAKMTLTCAQGVHNTFVAGVTILLNMPPAQRRFMIDRWERYLNSIEAP